MQYLKDPDITIPYVVLLGKIIPEKVRIFTNPDILSVSMCIYAVGQEEMGNHALQLSATLLLSE